MKQLTDFFQDKQISSILDVGTGTGDFIPVLKDAFPLGKITGVDPNIESLRTAAENYPDITFNTMVGENLEFAANSFDVASISMALHHLPEIQQSLLEMQRVVKSGGWIIVSELFSDNLNPAQEVHKMFHHFRSSIDRILGVSHNETFKKKEILKMVGDSGIDIQLNFEFKKDVNMISNEQELEERVEKMKTMLESINGFPQYESLKPQIELFRERAEKYGFQPATKVVIVGKVK